MDAGDRTFPEDSLKLSDRCKEVTIDEIMSKDPICFREDDSVEDIIELALQHPYHIYPVTDRRGKLVGTIDLDNILGFIFFERMPGNGHAHLLAVKALSEKAGTLMVHHPLSVDQDANLCDVADLMMKQHVDRICVVREKNLVGVISKLDVIKKIYSLRGN